MPYDRLAGMMRRLYAIAVVFLLSGILPLAAVAGFCATKPCCRAHSHSSMSSLGAKPGCCDTINCDTTAQRIEATGAKSTTAQPQPSVATLSPLAVITAPPANHWHDRLDTGPPPTRQRLATLSILLI